MIHDFFRHIFVNIIIAIHDLVRFFIEVWKNS